MDGSLIEFVIHGNGEETRGVIEDILHTLFCYDDFFSRDW